MKLLLDNNVVLDILQNREPWAASGIQILRAIAAGQHVGCLTAKQIADLHFFARKMFKGEPQVDAKARQVVEKLLAIFVVLDTQAEDCHTALGIHNGDFEDAMLIAAAARMRLDCIVTRNPVHFPASPTPVYTPEAFVQAQQL